MKLFAQCLVIGFVAYSHDAPAADDLAGQKKPCSSDQAKVVKIAMETAKDGLYKAIKSMKTPSPDDVNRQQKWYGALSSDSAVKIQGVYERSLVVATFTQFWCPLSNDLAFKWGPGDLAAVHQDAPGAVFLTPDFFKLQTSGADSQLGTFIHELTHLSGIGLRPEVYGVTKSKQLAIEHPEQARNNSDNYQYYVEDLLFKLP